MLKKQDVLFLFLMVLIILGCEYFKENETSLEDKKVKVGIIDSGIFVQHELFKNLNLCNYDILEKKEVDNPIDLLGHGTAVTSVIVNNLELEEQKNIQFFNIVYLNENGKGEVEYFVDAVEWAITKEIDVLNLSIGFQSYHSEIERVVKKALDSGMIIISSAGNNLGFNSDFPARFKDVISVSAVTKENMQLATSSTGKVDFVAQGQNIKVADLDGTYKIQSGSSLATAYITSFVMKEMLSKSNIKNNKDAFNLLKKYALDLGVDGKDEIYGYGLIKM
ncbi:S8 family peptidase [Lysinibacillus sp. FSL W8-0992]|uniref:S8 family peptidase n=1 Tax=Lysinibacillus sp. FSL W8-0992 TaxID=2954643 RepID=UPI0030F779C8